MISLPLPICLLYAFLVPWNGAWAASLCVCMCVCPSFPLFLASTFIP